MNKFLIATFFLVNIAMPNAVFLKKPTVSRMATFTQLRDISDSSFGKRILETIALQLKNKSPLGDVAKMLSDILANLNAQQTEADSLNAAQRLECAEDIARFTANRDTCQTNANDAEEAIGLLESEILALSVKIAEMNRQEGILANRAKQLAIAREQDIQSYNNRKAQGPGVLDALDLIIEKLQTIEPTSAHGAFAQLAKIGNTNPIAALLQVASTFSKDTLDSVVGKMNDLKEQIAAALENDDANEQEAAAQYKQIVGEIASTRKNVAAAKAQAESEKKSAESNLALQRKKYADNVKCVADNVAKLAAKHEQCDAWAAKYADDTKSRAGEIQIIKDVQTIVATRLDTMNDFLKDAANAA